MSSTASNIKEAKTEKEINTCDCEIRIVVQEIKTSTGDLEVGVLAQMIDECFKTVASVTSDSQSID